MISNMEPLSSIQRHRPINASWLFVSLVLIFGGLFFSERISAAFSFLLILSAVGCLLWQFKIWSYDVSVNRLATEWCRTHYPFYGDTPIVDFMVAIGQDTCCDFDEVFPSTALDDLNRYEDNVMLFIDDKEILEHILRGAHFRQIDCSEFDGSTLDDAIQFVVNYEMIASM